MGTGEHNHEKDKEVDGQQIEKSTSLTTVTTGSNKRTARKEITEEGRSGTKCNPMSSDIRSHQRGIKKRSKASTIQITVEKELKNRKRNAPHKRTSSVSLTLKEDKQITQSGKERKWKVDNP